MQLKVKKTFTWAHRYVDVQQHQAGDVIETEDADLIRVSQEEGWTGKAKESKPDAKTKAMPEAEIAELDAPLTPATQAEAPALQADLAVRHEAVAPL